MSTMQSLRHRLKQINCRLKEIALVKQANRERNRLTQEKTTIEAKIRERASGKIQVSDHAIVRYMERVHGIDMDQIRREIVGGDLGKLALPSGQFGVASHRIRVIDGVVITVLVKDDDVC